jgi:lysozyme family protein
MTDDPIFGACMVSVLNSEKGYQCDPKDPGNWTGGARGQGELKGTNFGISARSYPNEDIKGMKLARATELYLADFYAPSKLAMLPRQAMIVTVKVFDVGVDIGMRHAVTCLQRALRSLGRKVAEDGLVGEEVAGAVFAVDVQPLYAAVKSELAGYYRLVAQTHPDQAGELAGWLNRAYS